MSADDRRRSPPRSRHDRQDPHDPHAAPEPPRPAERVVIGGRYELLSTIGRGGCAVIYEARDQRLGRLVALKVVKENARDARAPARLAREVRSGAAIHHPNVCGIVDAGYLDDGRPFLVMERLHGETLSTCLARIGRVAPSDAIDVALQLLSALDAVHSIGIVHRDVKPDNVFLVPRRGCRPLVKLLDFGMCRRVTPTWRDDATLTRAGQVVGTPEYMSPEQVIGSRAFDERIDIYAVGVVLYEALSGRRAYQGKDAREVVMSVAKSNIAPLREVSPDVPAELCRVVSRAVERDPAGRYASATAFQKGLLRAEDLLHLVPDETDGGDWEQPTVRIAPRRPPRRAG